MDDRLEAVTILTTSIQTEIQENHRILMDRLHRLELALGKQTEMATAREAQAQNPLSGRLKRQSLALVALSALTITLVVGIILMMMLVI